MIGELGESFANIFLARCTTQGHLFRTAMMGGKWPTIDIYAEVISNMPQKMFCFFQIKTTDQGYTKRQRNLRISLDLRDLVRLSQYAAPTYVIGVDHNAARPHYSKAYIGAIRGNYSQGISSLPTTYPLNNSNLIMLREEIIAFWNTLNPLNTKENYLTKFRI
jgi:hypothetical protein